MFLDIIQKHFAYSNSTCIGDAWAQEKKIIKQTITKGYDCYCHLGYHITKWLSWDTQRHLRMEQGKESNQMWTIQSESNFRLLTVWLTAQRTKSWLYILCLTLNHDCPLKCPYHACGRKINKLREWLRWLQESKKRVSQIELLGSGPELDRSYQHS